MLRALSSSEFAVLGLGALACWFDIRTRRLPNLLTFGGAALALGYWLWVGGPDALATSVAAWFLGAALFFPFFALGGMGAGDVKLLACIGAWLGPMAVVHVALYAAIAGGVLALVVAFVTGYLRRALENFRLMVVHWRVMGVRPLPELTLERSGGPRLPYALPIVAGALVTIWLK